MKIFSSLFKIQLHEVMVYRFHFFLRIFFSFIPVVVTIFIWETIYTENHSMISQLSGFSKKQFIGYLLITNITSSMLNFNYYSIGMDIRLGTLNSYLLKPLSYFKYKFLESYATFVLNIIFWLTPIVIVAYKCDFMFANFLIYFVQLFISMVLYFLLMYAISLISFWFLEISSLFSIFNFLSSFFAGTMFPLHILPYPIQELSFILPFRYLGYEISMIFFSKVTFQQLGFQWSIQLIMIAILYFIIKTLWTLGEKKYAAFGN